MYNRDPKPDLDKQESTESTEEIRAKELRQEAIHGIQGVPHTGILSKIVRRTIFAGDQVDEETALNKAEEDFDETLKRVTEDDARSKVKYQYQSSTEPPEVVADFMKMYRIDLISRFTDIGVEPTTATSIVDTQILKNQ